MASAYGWSKDYILDRIYPDEVPILMSTIKKRKYGEYMIQLAIAQNPHVKTPKTLWKILREQAGEMGEGSQSSTLDKEKFKKVKGFLKKKSHLIDVK